MNISFTFLFIIIINIIERENPSEISINPSQIDKFEFVVQSTDNSGYIITHLFHGSQNKSYNICYDNMTLFTANVLCQQLNNRMAYSVSKYPIFDNTKYLLFFNHLNCYGNEESLEQCSNKILLKESSYCSSSSIFGLRCVQALPNLIPDIESLESSIYVHTEPLYHLQCAMEENCLDEKTNKKYGNWSQEKLYTLTDNRELQRRLLRFSSIIKNTGTAAFLPHLSSDNWQWHNCHEHYHSMDNFAIYQIFSLSTESLKDPSGLILAGHKASFCLEDNICIDGVTPYFKCSRNKSRTGTQGISPGCSDTYLHDVDCQWIDITFLKYDRYIFRMIINPNLSVGESNYYDNAIACELYYFAHYTGLHYCHLTHSLTFW